MSIKKRECSTRLQIENQGKIMPDSNPRIADDRKSKRENNRVVRLKILNGSNRRVSRKIKLLNRERLQLLNIQHDQITV